MYDSYLTVDPNLLPSEFIFPCRSRGYNEYVETVTFGEPPLTMDMYKKESKTTDDKCCEGGCHLIKYSLVPLY